MTKMWHSQAQMGRVRNHERIIVRGDGAHVWDDQGNRLLDGPASLWYCNVGHGRTAIADAVARQMTQLETYSTFQRFANEPARQLTDRLAALVPIDDPAIYLTSGGSDAVDFAAKLSRRFWTACGRPEKTSFVTRTNAYHGLHTMGTSIAGPEIYREGLGQLVDGNIVAPWDDLDALRSLFDERADQIAAMFVEPVIGSGGVFASPDGYLAGVAELCRSYDVLFIADEVITGFGRTGKYFASAGTSPDMLLMAKGISSGYLPLGAVAVAERVATPFFASEGPVLRHGLTYSGHASCAAAALANLDIIDDEDLVAEVARKGKLLADAALQLRSLDCVVDVRAADGLIAGVQLYESVDLDRVVDGCYEHGVITRVLLNRTLQLSPPFVISESDIELLCSVIGDQIGEAARRGSS
jgi:adenosylmethionine-8-amino-7-oxononanoate aminotransferase